jgi:hypothetical protein
MERIIISALNSIEENGVAIINLYANRDYKNPEIFEFNNCVEVIEFIEFVYLNNLYDLQVVK